jgi:hypothetical protein
MRPLGSGLIKDGNTAQLRRNKVYYMPPTPHTNHHVSMTAAGRFEKRKQKQKSTRPGRESLFDGEHVSACQATLCMFLIR